MTVTAEYETLAEINGTHVLIGPHLPCSALTDGRGQIVVSTDMGPIMFVLMLFCAALSGWMIHEANAGDADEKPALA